MSESVNPEFATVLKVMSALGVRLQAIPLSQHRPEERLCDTIERMARQPDDDQIFDDLERFVETQGVRLDIEALLDDIDKGRRRTPEL